MGPTGAGKSPARAADLRAQALQAPGLGRLRRGQLRDAEGRQRDVGAVRAPEGRVHRRRRRPARAAARGRQRHAVPRRDRRARARRAGDDPARDRGQAVPAGRRGHARPRPTSSSSPAPTATSAPRSRRAASARICSRGSTCGPSRCRRSATGARISSPTSTTSSTASPSARERGSASTRRRGGPISTSPPPRGAPGPAISATSPPASPGWRRFAPARADRHGRRWRRRSCRLTRLWSGGGAAADADGLEALLGAERLRGGRPVRARPAGRGGAHLPHVPLAVRGRPRLVQRLARPPRQRQRRRPAAQISAALRARLGRRHRLSGRPVNPPAVA